MTKMRRPTKKTLEPRCFV